MPSIRRMLSGSRRRAPGKGFAQQSDQAPELGRRAGAQPITGRLRLGEQVRRHRRVAVREDGVAPDAQQLGDGQRVIDLAQQEFARIERTKARLDPTLPEQ